LGSLKESDRRALFGVETLCGSYLSGLRVYRYIVSEIPTEKEETDYESSSQESRESYRGEDFRKLALHSVYVKGVPCLV
jgi:hypothetical protein